MYYQLYKFSKLYVKCEMCVCVLTYSHGRAVFANTSIQNDMEVVVAGVEGPSDDANDGEDVQLQSEDGQLRKHVKVTLVWRHKAFSL